MRTPAAPNPRPTHPVRPGFTLIELIVAVSVTSLLLLLVSRVFNETTKAINIGTDTSQIVASSRTLNDQIFQDTGRMYVAKAPPSLAKTPSGKLEEPGGFLVLIQQTNTGVRYPTPGSNRPDPEGWTTFRDRNGNGVQDGTDPDEEPTWDPIRTDQLAFFGPANQAESITPGSDSRYDSDAFAQHQRIWIGHVGRANLDGTRPNALEPGLSDPADDFDHTLVSNLVLGRQALLILDDDALWPDGQTTFDRSAAFPVTRSPAGDTIYANGRSVGSGFDLGTRIDTLDVENVTPPQGIDGANYDQIAEGTTDLLRLRDSDVAFSVTGSRFPGFFENQETGNNAPVDGLYATGGNLATRTGVGTALDNNELPTEAYARHALGWAFATPNAGRPLTTQDLDYPYAPADVARNHTFFMPYVSDFAVDFAADITDDYAWADDPNTDNEDGTPLRDWVLLPWWDERWQPGYPGGQWARFQPNAQNGTWVNNPGNNFAPDGLPDGRPDEYAIFNAAGVFQGSGIKWYNMSFDRTLTGTPAGNPVITFPIPGRSIGEAFNRTQPAFYRLPRNIAAGAAGPYPNAANQVDGAYHTDLTRGNVIEYPPLVGYRGDAALQSLAPNRNILSADPGTLTLSAPIQSRAAYVFGHTSDYDLDNNPAFKNLTAPYDDGSDDTGFEAGAAKWWPYALRVRYRIHDGDGSYSSVGEIPSQVPVPGDPSLDVFDPLPGKWFEQVIPVRHHDNHLPETSAYEL